MNWTEGALHRHSKGKGWDEELARQKKYFAQARLRSQVPDNRPSREPAPFIPDYIFQSIEDQNQHLSSSRSTRLSRKASKSSPSRQLIHLSSDSVAAPTSDDISSPCTGFRKRDRQPRVDLRDSDDEYHTLNEKRRKLLEASDWSGIEFQKPLIVDYSQKADKTGAGTSKYRDVKGHSRNHIIRQSHKQSQYGDVGNDRWHSPSRGAQDGLRLRIGSQSLRWSRDGNTIRSPSHTRDVHSPSSYVDPRLLHSNPLEILSSAASHVACSSRSSSCRTSETNCEQMSSQYDDACHGPLRALRVASLQNAPLCTPPHVVQCPPKKVYQPQPLKGERSSLVSVTSPSPRMATSVGAEVGAVSDMRSQDARNHEEWRLWLAPDVSEAKVDPTNPHTVPAETRPITPGVSQVGLALGPSLLQSPGRESTSPLMLNLEDTHAPNGKAPASYDGAEGQFEPSHLSTHSSAPQMRAMESPSVELFDIPPLMGKDTGTLDKRKAGTSNIGDTGPRIPASQNQSYASEGMEPLAQVRLQSDGSCDGHRAVSEEKPKDSEEELWRKFLHDDDCAVVSTRALDAAMDSTRRQLRNLPEGPEAMPSDAAEPPSPLVHAIPVSIPSTGGMLSDPHPDIPMSSSPIGIPSRKPSATPTGTVTSVLAQQGSPDCQIKQSSSDFKFHQPRLFVGRLASTGTNPGQPPRSPPVVRGRRGRSRKKRDCRRPDIRAMPNFDEDPIENDSADGPD